jgi:hypothetical protein
MKALNINQQGWLFKLAKFGGMSEDGQVTDWHIRRTNKLLLKMREEEVIDAREYYERRKCEERDINFCEFTRKVLRGVALGMFLAVVGLSLAFNTIFGTAALFIRFFGNQAILKEKFWHGMLATGTVQWILMLIVAVLFLGCYLNENIPRWREKYRRVQTADELRKRKEEESDRLNAKLAKREVRSAFWAVVHNKACFKVDFE